MCQVLFSQSVLLWQEKTALIMSNCQVITIHSLFSSGVDNLILPVKKHLGMLPTMAQWFVIQIFITIHYSSLLGSSPWQTSIHLSRALWWTVCLKLATNINFKMFAPSFPYLAMALQWEIIQLCYFQNKSDENWRLYYTVEGNIHIYDLQSLLLSAKA